MTDLIAAYTEGFSIFFEGMPSDVISLAVTGIALAVGCFFVALPILLIRKGVHK